MRVPLVQCSILDPRPADEAAAAPLAGAVNIPLAELPGRTHELSPRGVPITVAGPVEVAEAAVTWLARAGRSAAIATELPRADGGGPCAGGATGGAAAAIGRLWQPNAFLADVLAHLAAGRALDLACGTGRDAVYLASCGWEVTAVDVLPDALERARDLARRCAAAIVPIRFWCDDLEADKAGGAIAADAAGQITADAAARTTAPRAAGGWRAAAPFDLIAGFRYLHRPLMRRLPELVRAGGSVVWETFTTEHRARHGRPASDARVLRPGELRELLGGLAVREHAEGWRGGAHTARIWAVRA